jgi:hypothetical protein
MSQNLKFTIVSIAIASLIPIGLGLALWTKDSYYLVMSVIGFIIIAAGG